MRTSCRRYHKCSETLLALYVKEWSFLIITIVFRAKNVTKYDFHKDEWAGGKVGVHWRLVNCRTYVYYKINIKFYI